MSDTTPDTKPTETEPKKHGHSPLAWIVSAVLAGAAAFGGAGAAVKYAPRASAATAEHKKELTPPGPTVALEPFLVSIPDANKHAHAMKLTLAVEFDATAKEEAVKSFTPRIRDALLSHIRTLAFEDAESKNTEKLRAELLESCRKAGATSAERVLITDLVTQ